MDIAQKVEPTIQPSEPIPVGSLVRIIKIKPLSRWRQYVIGYATCAAVDFARRLAVTDSAPTERIPYGTPGLLVLEYIENPVDDLRRSLPSEYKVLYEDKVVWVRCSSVVRMDY